MGGGGAVGAFSYEKLVTYLNDGTSPKSVRKIRRSEYPEYNFGNTRTAKLNIIFGCTCEGIINILFRLFVK